MKCIATELTSVTVTATHNSQVTISTAPPPHSIRVAVTGLPVDRTVLGRHTTTHSHLVMAAPVMVQLTMLHTRAEIVIRRGTSLRDAAGIIGEESMATRMVVVADHSILPLIPALITSTVPPPHLNTATEHTVLTIIIIIIETQ